MTKTLFNEVYVRRDPILKKIDNCFYHIQKRENLKENKRELVNLIKEFTGIKTIFLSFKKSLFNAGVIPIYHWKPPKDEGESLPPVGESPKYIEKIYVIFGWQLIDFLTHRECTAILLHELGHCFYHFSNMSRILERVTSVLSDPLHGAIAYVYLHSPMIVFTLFIISRSLTLLDHLQEYDCDEFAAKHGYLEEMATSLNKIKNRSGFNVPKNNKFFRRIYSIIVDIVLLRTTHPNIENRICKLVTKSKNEYVKMYPNFKQELNIILSNLKC